MVEDMIKNELERNFQKCALIFFTLMLVIIVITKLIFNQYSTHEDVGEFEQAKLTVIGLLSKNLIVCFIAILGLVSKKITSWFILIINSVVLGFTLGINWAVTGKFWYFAKYIVFHGIFELSAIFLACAIGMLSVASKKELTVKRLAVLVLCVTGLLVVAAFIETYISANL